eukprot:CAMPEP_0113670268 /NCGR_PEP_ID=MMETSP0038_2-20120614/5044_1 /TAXON_ID=2898 /ORGANISM="Cryptomonas paramecium" /LENGTH=121 /DNA_ID=CAMNT_0000586269 /DNA_START=537 /DNA_END=899 /DNA_ORIENTATION=- /assembly_acc=CAM_ASM_000170
MADVEVVQFMTMTPEDVCAKLHRSALRHFERATVATPDCEDEQELENLYVPCPSIKSLQAGLRKCRQKASMSRKTLRLLKDAARKLDEFKSTKSKSKRSKVEKRKRPETTVQLSSITEEYW